MEHKSIQNHNILGLDVGEVRVGVAIAGSIAKIPAPVATLDRKNNIFSNIEKLVKHENIKTIVVGVPRNLDGQETPQSQAIKEFAAELQQKIGLEIIFADETLSTVRAQNLSNDHRKNKEGLDALAACFILEEFFNDQKV